MGFEEVVYVSFFFNVFYFHVFFLELIGPTFGATTLQITWDNFRSAQEVSTASSVAKEWHARLYLNWLLGWSSRICASIPVQPPTIERNVVVAVFAFHLWPKHECETDEEHAEKYGYRGLPFEGHQICPPFLALGELGAWRKCQRRGVHSDHQARILLHTGCTNGGLVE